MNGANPICDINGYHDKIAKIFPDLLSLDGNRKTVTMNCNMIQAVPEDEEIKVDYDTSNVAWFDATGDLDDPNMALATRFEPGTNLKREERELDAMLKDMKDLLKRK